PTPRAGRDGQAPHEDPTATPAQTPTPQHSPPRHHAHQGTSKASASTSPIPSNQRQGETRAGAAIQHPRSANRPNPTRPQSRTIPATFRQPSQRRKRQARVTSQRLHSVHAAPACAAPTSDYRPIP